MTSMAKYRRIYAVHVVVFTLLVIAITQQELLQRVSVSYREYNVLSATKLVNKTIDTPSSDPQLQPAQPKLQPAQAKLQPAEPKLQPTQSNLQPAEPKLKPAQPILQPAQPKLQPAQPKLKPVEPKLQPAENELQVYPEHGTGPTIDISGAFDANVFNSFCDTEVALKAVLPIYSTVDRFELRNILRNTLGKWAKKLNCKIFFIAGVSPNKTINVQIQEEYAREMDILMMGKLDAYRDLNDKAVLMVEWLSRYCNHVPYVIHLIDDAYINLQMFLNLLDSIKSKNYMVGGLMDRMRAPRNSRLKTFVTKREYPEERFPRYAIGFAYAFPTNISRRLLVAAYKARYVWIEDVWFTGTVREAAGVDLIPLRRKDWKANEDKPIPHLLDGLPPYYMIHTVEPELFHELYSTVSI